MTQRKKYIRSFYGKILQLLIAESLFKQQKSVFRALEQRKVLMVGDTVLIFFIRSFELFN